MTASSGFSANFGLRVAESRPDARVVTVTGQVDGPAGLELGHCLIAQLAMARVVIVDLDGVQLIGSTGLSALFEANELATGPGCALRLVCHSRIAMRALETAGLRQCFTFADSIPEALKSSLQMSDLVEMGVARRLYRRPSRRSPPRNRTAARHAATPRRRQPPATPSMRSPVEALKGASHPDG